MCDILCLAMLILLLEKERVLHAAGSKQVNGVQSGVSLFRFDHVADREERGGVSRGAVVHV